MELRIKLTIPKNKFKQDFLDIEVSKKLGVTMDRILENMYDPISKDLSSLPDRMIYSIEQVEDENVIFEGLLTYKK